MKRIRILALLIAVAVMIMMAIIFLPKEQTNKPMEEVKKTVVVAKKTIPAYAEITEDMVETMEYPESAVAPNAVLKLENVIGSRTLVEISPQETLMSNHLLKAEDIAGGLSMLLDSGMRAMSVRVDEVSGVSNLLKVGNYVDVIAVAPNPKENNEVVANMLLENIEIVALDTALLGNSLGDDGNPYYKTVTLAVTPQDAVKLALSSHEGTVYLIGRSQNDNDNVKTSPVRISDIIRGE